MLLGDAGIGKTVVAAVLAQRMQAQNRLGAAFFCRHNNSTRRNPRYLLSSIAYHIGTGNPQYYEIIGGCDGIQKLIANYELGIHELFTKLLEEPLSRCKPSAQRQLVVVDALDESQYEGHPDLLDLIVQKFPSLPPWVVFFITSRPEEQIQFRFELFKPCVRICSGDGQKGEYFQKHCADLETFIRKKLITIFPGQTRVIEEQGKVLLKKCEGLFLFAHHIIEHIQSLPSLEPDTIASLYPMGLRQFYHENFKRMWNILGETCFKELIGCAVVSPGPLPTSFISVALAKLGTQLTKQKILDTISVFFPINSSEDTFSFLHSLVPNWLTDEKEAREYFIDRKAASNSLRDFMKKALHEIAQDSTISQRERSIQSYVLRYGVRFLCEGDCEDVASSLYSCLTNLAFAKAKLSINRSMVYSLIDDYQICVDTMKTRLAADQIRTLELLGKIFLDNGLLLSKFPNLLYQLTPRTRTQVQQTVVHAILKPFPIETRYVGFPIRYAFSSDRSLIACITEEGNRRFITILKVPKRNLISKTEIPFPDPCKPCFSPDNCLVFLGRLDKWFSVDKASFVDLPQFSSNTRQYISGSLPYDGEFLLVDRGYVKSCGFCSFFLLCFLCELEVIEPPSRRTLEFCRNLEGKFPRYSWVKRSDDEYDMIQSEIGLLLRILEAKKECATTEKKSFIKTRFLLEELIYRHTCSCRLRHFISAIQDNVADADQPFQFQLWHIKTGKSLLEMLLDPLSGLTDRRLSVLAYVTCVILNPYYLEFSRDLMLLRNGQSNVDDWYFCICLLNIYKHFENGIVLSDKIAKVTNFQYFKNGIVMSQGSQEIFLFTGDRLHIISLPSCNSRYKVSPSGHCIAVCDSSSHFKSTGYLTKDVSSNRSVLTISKLSQTDHEAFEEIDHDVLNFNFSLDNKHLLYTKYDGCINAYSLQDLAVLNCLDPFLIHPECLFSDGRQNSTLYAGDVATVHVFPFLNSLTMEMIEPSVIKGVCFFLSNVIEVYFQDGKTSVLSQQRSRLTSSVKHMVIKEGRTDCACIGSNGEQLLVVLDNLITVISQNFEIVSSQETEMIGPITALSTDGKKLLQCFTDEFAQIVNIWKNGRVISSLSSFQQISLVNVECGCFVPGNENFVVLCGGYEIQIWDYNHQTCVQTYRIFFRNYKVKCTFCTCSVNADLLACCVGDRVDIFSLRPTGKRAEKAETQLTGHCGCVRWCQFIKGNRYLVTYGVDRYILLWDLDKKIPVGCVCPAVGKEKIVSVAVSPEEDLLVCALSSGRLTEIELQGLEARQQSSTLNTVVNRTRSETQQFPRLAVFPSAAIPGSQVQHSESADLMLEHDEYGVDADVSSSSDESDGDSGACTEDDCGLR